MQKALEKTQKKNEMELFLEFLDIRKDISKIEKRLIGLGDLKKKLDDIERKIIELEDRLKTLDQAMELISKSIVDLEEIIEEKVQE